MGDTGKDNLPRESISHERIAAAHSIDLKGGTSIDVSDFSTNDDA